jgi:hypothetical protein
MPLVIEATDESGPLGLPAISVCHYGEQNGDAMRDPEMSFELGFAGDAQPTCSNQNVSQSIGSLHARGR